MKKQTVYLLIACLILLAIAAAVFAQAHARRDAVPSSPEPTASPDLTDVSDPQDSIRLSAEVLHDQVLRPLLSYHPGTAGSSLMAASASASVLDFASANQLRLADQGDVNRLMAEAVAQLTEEEQGWLPESASGVISLIDDTLSNYEANKGVYEDSGSADLVLAALNRPGAAEDWARLKAAFDACVPADSSIS